MHIQPFLLFPALRHPASRSYALRLAAASILAMAAATVFSIANPWWAAMAVWMIGQPTRGLLLERSLMQLLGTLAGGLAAVGLAALTDGAPALLLTALCVWLGLCCGASNLLRHQRAYGAALCGLTTAVIVVLTVGTPLDTAAFATARMLDNMIGITASLLVIALWNPPSPAAALLEKTRDLLCATLAHAALQLGPGLPTDLVPRARRLVAALAELETTAEDATAGSLSQRRRLKPLRGLLAGLLDLVAIMPALRQHATALAPAHAEDLDQLRASLDDLAETIQAGRGTSLAIVRTATRRLRGADPLFDTCLDEFEQALAAIAASYRNMAATLPEPAASASVHHPDIAGVRIAAWRGVAIPALAAGAWLASGWEPLRYLMLGACIFTALFASVDEPVPLMRRVLAGATAAAVAAFAWRVGIAPVVSHPWLSLALASPLILAAATAQAHRGTAFIGLAFNMLFAVLAQPVNIGPAEPMALLTVELMLLTGIACSYAAYRWLIPMTTQRRRRHLHRAIRAEVAAIAQQAGTPARAARHLARLRFLILALIARSGMEAATADGALAALSLGHALARMGHMLDRRPDAPEAPWIGQALHTMSKPLAMPHDAGATLQNYATRARAAGASATMPAVRWLEEAAEHLTEHTAFFRTQPARKAWAPQVADLSSSRARQSRERA
ncbi:FUSC family protein [Pigmentiphaga sp. GD03639]|uniref:FUSC family protein n=1 Tax=Pigmentiphaga sp. GD03639 TaxID=2975354 RepID=UPI002447D0C1|nr:FUSC family protein [Pigmentiphaga sp. GD03639]MDH2235755.1 FUSC family protein [Pigmentiphaga sp. GD03639]